MDKKLIKNATIISVDPDIGDIIGGDILIDGTKIVEIGMNLEAQDAEVIDATNCIAIPGFIDTHRHTWESLLRTAGPDWSLAQYFTGVRGVMGSIYTPNDIKIANELGALDSLDGGITTLFDWSHCNNSPDHADAAIEGLRASGIRGVFGYGNSNDEWAVPSDLPSDWDDIRRVRRDVLSSDDALVTMATAPRGPQFTNIEGTTKDFDLARELGLRISVHVGDGLWGMSKPLVDLKNAGLLGEDVTYVHCNTLADEEFKIIGDSGGHVSISPEIEMQMGHGNPPALRMLGAGIRPSLSSDVVTTCPSDFFNAMRHLLSGTRLMVNMVALENKKLVDPLPLSCRETLEFATIRGAAACGLDHKTGSLTLGKEADIVLVSTNYLNMFPVNNPIAAVVEFANVGNIDTILVAGEVKKRNGKLVGLDIGAFRSKVDAARDDLFARAGVPTDGSWEVRPYTEGLSEF
ncbi:amidohydrolase family protein [Rhodobacteraceae bacterium Araon29]